VLRPAPRRPPIIIHTPEAAAGDDPGAGPNVQGQEDVPIPRWMRDRDRTWLRYPPNEMGPVLLGALALALALPER
jgi:hypothetical protein